MKQVMAYYNSNGTDHLHMIFHPFSLPYHHNAFFTAVGSWVIANNVGVSGDKVWTYVDTLFIHQVEFQNRATADMSPNQVWGALAALVEKDVGFPSADFLAGMANFSNVLAAEISWKYGCSRTFSGTPNWLVNGIPVAGDSSWTLSDWRFVLDPLMSSTVSKASAGRCDTWSPRVAPQLVKVSSEEEEEADGQANAEWKPVCPEGEQACEYLPNKWQCCKDGESCVRNVGCRC